MTQEEKQLLLKDLSARLPYGVFCNIGLGHPLLLQSLFVDKLDGVLLDFYEDGKDYQVYLSEVKPYLRPLSSMTEEETKEYQSLCEIHFDNNADANFIAYYFDSVESFDWLNKNMFDYRELIPKDLAIEVTENNNPYKD